MPHTIAEHLFSVKGKSCVVIDTDLLFWLTGGIFNAKTRRGKGAKDFWWD